MTFIYFNCLFLDALNQEDKWFPFAAIQQNCQIKIASISLCIIHINIKFDTQNRGVLAGTVLKRWIRLIINPVELQNFKEQKQW